MQLLLNSHFFSITISTLQKILMGHLDIWGDFLEAATFSINNRIREATGYSAHELMYGRKARLPIEAEAWGNQMKLLTLYLLLMKIGMKMLRNSLRPLKILCINPSSGRK